MITVLRYHYHDNIMISIWSFWHDHDNIIVIALSWYKYRDNGIVPTSKLQSWLSSTWSSSSWLPETWWSLASSSPSSFSFLSFPLSLFSSQLPASSPSSSLLSYLVHNHHHHYSDLDGFPSTHFKNVSVLNTMQHFFLILLAYFRNKENQTGNRPTQVFVSSDGRPAS